VHACKISLPPLPEQKRIVAVLETWEKGIEVLEKKITVKQNIKKGLMQKLLTGTVRLAGFTEEWEMIEFFEIFKVLSKPKGIKSNDYENFGTPTIDQSKDSFESGFTNRSDYIYKFSDEDSVILFGDHSRVIKYIEEDVAFGNDGSKLFKTHENFNNKFSFFLLRNFRIPETGYNRHFKYLKDAIFEIPKSKTEQTAIANILTIADNETEALEKKRELLQEQKKYLLNTLITGKIRTPKNMKCIANEHISKVCSKN
jgi:type I restriction enzyme S subunit